MSGLRDLKLQTFLHSTLRVPVAAGCWSAGHGAEGRKEGIFIGGHLDAGTASPNDYCVKCRCPDCSHKEDDEALFTVGEFVKHAGRGAAKNNNLVLKVMTGPGPDTQTAKEWMRSFNRDFEARERLVGTRVSVYWPGQKRWFDGRVSSFDERSCTHHVKYDDGDEEDLRLALEIMRHLPQEENGMGNARAEHTPPRQLAPASADTPASALRCLLPLLTPPQSEAIKAQEQGAAALRANIAQLEEEQARLLRQAVQVAGDQLAGPSSGAMALTPGQAVSLLKRQAEETKAANTQAEERVGRKRRAVEALIASFDRHLAEVQGGMP